MNGIDVCRNCGKPQTAHRFVSDLLDYFWVCPTAVFVKAEMEQFCLGCGKSLDKECGCPAGTAWRVKNA